MGDNENKSIGSQELKDDTGSLMVCSKYHPNRNDALFCTICGENLSPKLDCGYGYLLIFKGDSTESIHVISKNDCTIGREETNDICIKDYLISRKHARIYMNDGECGFEDLHSNNGSFVNGFCIKEKCALTNGSIIRLGSTVLIFKRSEQIP
jgi:hypothetical protein